MGKCGEKYMSLDCIILEAPAGMVSTSRWVTPWRIFLAAEWKLTPAGWCILADYTIPHEVSKSDDAHHCSWEVHFGFDQNNWDDNRWLSELQIDKVPFHLDKMHPTCSVANIHHHDCNSLKDQKGEQAKRRDQIICRTICPRISG